MDKYDLRFTWWKLQNKGIKRKKFRIGKYIPRPWESLFLYDIVLDC